MSSLVPSTVFAVPKCILQKEGLSSSLYPAALLLLHSASLETGATPGPAFSAYANRPLRRGEQVKPGLSDHLQSTDGCICPLRCTLLRFCTTPHNTNNQLFTISFRKMEVLSCLGWKIEAGACGIFWEGKESFDIQKRERNTHVLPAFNIWRWILP